MGDGLKQVLDYSDYLAAPADGQRYEILAGNLLVTPAPSPLHQRIVLRIAGSFREYFEPRQCEVFVAPIDLILTDHDVLQPDLLVIDDPALVTARGIEGPPVLVVEVLSPTTASRDRGVKASRYAELGIRHYWVVDPDARRIDCHRNVGSAFQCAIRCEGDATIRDPAFAGLTLSPTELWADSSARSSE